MPKNSSAVRARPPRGSLARHAFLLTWLQLRIVGSYVWLFVRSKVFRSPPSEEGRAAIHRRNARRFKAVACQLKGANVKLGQIASLQGQLLPAAIVEELRSLRDAVTPTPDEQVVQLIEAEFDKPIDELYATFDRTPIATASMGQVHGATLHGGGRVVVKALHPGLERTVAIDLALMRFAIRVLKVFVKTPIDPMVILTETAAALQNELDLAHEGRATETLAKELGPMGIVVPVVHWERTSRRVLTLDFIDGVNVDKRAQLDEWRVDREKLMGVYLASFVQQALRGGYFHADPHPGNVFCTRDGKLALLDFGMVQRLPDDVRIGLMKEVLGGFFARPKLWTDGMIQKGAVGEADRARLEAFAETAFLDPKARAILFDHHAESRDDVSDVVRKFAAFFKTLETLQTPRDNVMFGRALGIIIDVMKEVVPEKSPSVIAGPIMMPVLVEFVQANPQYLELMNDLPAVIQVLAPGGL